MRVEGKSIIKASQQQVWEYLQNPEVLAKVIPGCQEFRSIEENKYEVVVKLGAGPVKGKYDVKINVVNIINTINAAGGYELHYELHIEGSGLGSFMRIRAPIDLKAVAEDKTEVIWMGEGDVGGRIAGVGNRILIGVAKTLIGQFFASIEDQILRRPNLLKRMFRLLKRMFTLLKRMFTNKGGLSTLS